MSPKSRGQLKTYSIVSISPRKPTASSHAPSPWLANAKAPLTVSESALSARQPPHSAYFFQEGSFIRLSQDAATFSARSLERCAKRSIRELSKPTPKTEKFHTACQKRNASDDQSPCILARKIESSRSARASPVTPPACRTNPIRGTIWFSSAHFLTPDRNFRSQTWGDNSLNGRSSRFRPQSNNSSAGLQTAFPSATEPSAGAATCPEKRRAAWRRP